MEYPAPAFSRLAIQMNIDAVWSPPAPPAKDAAKRLNIELPVGELPATDTPKSCIGKSQQFLSLLERYLAEFYRHHALLNDNQTALCERTLYS